MHKGSMQHATNIDALRIGTLTGFNWSVQERSDPPYRSRDSTPDSWPLGP